MISKFDKRRGTLIRGNPGNINLLSMILNLLIGADIDSLVDIDNKKQDILILDKVPTNSIGDTTLK